MSQRPATLCVRAGIVPDPTTGALVPALVQSTTYRWPSIGTPPPVSYARAGNATVHALEGKITALEEGGEAVAFGSGLAAIGALLWALPDGARVVAGRHLYGGTTRLLGELQGGRLQVVTVDSTDNEAVTRALAGPTALVLVETPSNPTLRITDLRHAIQAGHDAGALVAVDNTFLTPLHQKPLRLGADISIQSTTKYLDGHNATLGGALIVHERHTGGDIARDGPLGSRLRWVRQATGDTLAPFEAWLTLQGAKTLHLRTAAQFRAARRLADTAATHEAVHTVHYPGLGTHPGHAVHRAQSSGDGGIVALDLGSYDAAARFTNHLSLFTLAENLGATESLVTHPAGMTHAALTAERRAADGIDDGLVRLSAGIEDPEDLEEDLLRALDAIHRKELTA